MLRALSSQVIKTSKGGATTALLGNLLLCPTVLSGKRFFLIPTLSLPCFSLPGQGKKKLNEMEAIYPSLWVKSSRQGTVIRMALWAPYPRPPNRCKRRSRELVSYLQMQFVPQYSLPGLGGRERREEYGTLHSH